MKILLDLKRKRRIIFVFGFVCFLFIILVAKLVYIQGIKSVDYGSRQSSMLMQKLPLTASRGDIYDRNMNLLAKDSSCCSIYVAPNSVEEAKKQEVSKYLSEKLDIDYKKIYKIVNSKSSANELLKSKVNNSIGLAIKKKDYTGVSVTEDKKRYYTNGKSGAYILGFTGTDHQGLYGIESTFNDTLSGKDGTVVYQTDGQGRRVASGTEVREEATDGSNVVLTIDSVIQTYAENALKTGMKKTGSKRMMAIVLDPNNGEVLAMASNPSYNPNDPWTLDSAFKNKFSSSLSGKSASEKLFDQWKNPLVSFNYEPGSTFKPVTVSSALDEGSITKNTKLYCSGYKTVAGTKIRCSIYPRSHGSENPGDALVNSCNPALIEIATRMGPDAFYDYIYNYGFGVKTGVALTGEEGGIVPSNENVSLVDYVTKSFGQGISATPIQMATALSAVINGGYLLKPQIVKYVSEGSSNKITKTYDKTVVRQVISKNTSATMRKYLRKVVTKGQVSKYDNKKIKMGGKTGTAQKIINGRYSHDKYVCSFFGFAPYDNPKLMVIVLADEPKTDKFGAVSAGPVAAEIIKNSLSYLDAKDSGNSAATTLSTKVTIPDVRGEKSADATSLLDSLNIKYKIKYTDNKKISSGVVVSQSDVQKTYNGGKIVITIGPSDDSKTNKVTVPDLDGMSVQKANEALEKAGLKIKADGGGVAYFQNVKAGTLVDKNSVITVKFKYIK